MRRYVRESIHKAFFINGSIFTSIIKYVTVNHSHKDVLGFCAVSKCGFKASTGHVIDSIHIYHNYDWEDYGREMFNNCGYELPGDLENYFDFEEYGESFSYSGNIEKFSGGLIEIN